jgi:hypothetical protein
VALSTPKSGTLISCSPELTVSCVSVSSSTFVEVVSAGCATVFSFAVAVCSVVSSLAACVFTLSKTTPSLTLSPSFTATLSTVPETGLGTSTVLCRTQAKSDCHFLNLIAHFDQDFRNGCFFHTNIWHLHNHSGCCSEVEQLVGLQLVLGFQIVALSALLEQVPVL